MLESLGHKGCAARRRFVQLSVVQRQQWTDLTEEEQEAWKGLPDDQAAALLRMSSRKERSKFLALNAHDRWVNERAFIFAGHQSVCPGAGAQSLNAPIHQSTNRFISVSRDPDLTSLFFLLAAEQQEAFLQLQDEKQRHTFLHELAEVEREVFMQLEYAVLREHYLSISARTERAAFAALPLLDRVMVVIAVLKPELLLVYKVS